VTPVNDENKTRFRQFSERSGAVICAVICARLHSGAERLQSVAPLPPAPTTSASRPDAGNSTAAMPETPAIAAELPVLSIDDKHSQITIIVRRGGLLAG
jgi:hypothetical protein